MIKCILKYMLALQQCTTFLPTFAVIIFLVMIPLTFCSNVFAAQTQTEWRV